MQNSHKWTAMHFKYLFAILCLAMSIPILACGQDNFNITSKIDQLKDFDYEPIYQLRIHTAYTYTILINGVPIANKLPYMNYYVAGINPCIPASGKQQIEIQVYPRFTDSETQKKFLENDIDFELTIEKTAWKDGSLVDPEIVYQYRLPDADYSSKKSIIHSAAFTAEVPYRLIDWRTGKTFEEKDSVTLKTKALQAYEKLIYLYENQHGEDFYNTIGKGLFNLYQASYFSKEDALNHLNRNISFIDKKKRDLEDIKNYRLEFLGNGKLLSLKRTDRFNREEGVLRRHYIKRQKETVHIYDVLFYSPENGQLEVVWLINLVKPTHP